MTLGSQVRLSAEFQKYQMVQQVHLEHYHKRQQCLIYVALVNLIYGRRVLLAQTPDPKNRQTVVGNDFCSSESKEHGLSITIYIYSKNICEKKAQDFICMRNTQWIESYIYIHTNVWNLETVAKPCISTILSCYGNFLALETIVIEICKHKKLSYSRTNGFATAYVPIICRFECW